MTSQRAVAAHYTSGVDAIANTSGETAGAQWEAPACGAWTAEETVRHVLAVARWYHAWLDRALAGDLSRPFPPEEMDRRNAADLAALTGLDGPTAAADFVATAQDYLVRAREEWDRPFAYPYGLVTVGLHCGVAAAEWHLHAWDMSQVLGSPHTPGDPRGLFLAAGGCVAAAEGGLRGAAMKLALPLASRRRPWETMLVRSGRVSSS